MGKPVIRAVFMLGLLATAGGVHGCAAGSSNGAQGAVATPTSNNLVGTWIPEEGFQDLPAEALERSYVAFAQDGTWKGSDGCNGLGGTYRLQGDFTFAAQQGGRDLVKCAGVQNGDLLIQATKVDMSDDSLTFRAGDGAKLITYRKK